MNPEELQNYILYLQEQIKSLKLQLNDFVERKIEYEVVKKTLEELKDGDEIIVPLGAGVFIKATVRESNKPLLGIGADVVIEKSKEGAIKLISEQQEKLDKMIEEVEKELDNLYKEYSAAVEEWNKLVRAPQEKAPENK